MLQRMMEQVSSLVGAYVPNLLGALGILLIGWLLALVLAALVRGALHRTALDNRVAQWLFGREAAEKLSIEHVVSRVVFYVIMLFVLVAFFQALQLTIVTDPLNALLRQLTEFAPRILGAGLILLVAGVVASVVRTIVSKGLSLTRLDARLGTPATSPPVSRTVSDAMYWLVLLLFLPGVLGALQLEGMLVPVRNLTNSLLGFLPSLLAAALIFAIGWFLATLVRRIVTNLLAAVGADAFAERVGLGNILGGATLSGVVGLLVYVLILLPVLISSLNALQLEAITQPASDMLGRILDAIPLIFAAALLLIIAYVAARIVAGLVSNVLASAGFDRVLQYIGLSQTTTGATSPSALVGTLTMVAIMIFAAIEASRMLGFDALAALVTAFLVFAGKVVLGLVVFGIGLYLASLAGSAIGTSTVRNARLLALAARIAIVGLAGAMALREMGLANEIVNLAFGLVLGSLAVAAAIAFGLGARDVAGRLVEGWARTIDQGGGRSRTS